MVTVIPLIHQLDNSYPLLGPHGKLKEFSQQRNFEFLDFYEEGFKNLDANNLKISKTDHHLNQNAGDIVASILFNKIKSLTKYKKLPYFNKAFTLKEILNEYPLLISLDNRLNKKNSVNTFILDSETKGLQVIRDPSQFIIKEIQKDKSGRNHISLIETKLSLSGDYISQEKVVFHPNSKTPRLRENISKQSDIYTQTIERIEADSKDSLVAIQLGQREFQFGFLGDEYHKRIKLEKDISFPDPKVLDKWIFQNNYPPSEKFSRQELIKMLIEMTIKNPKIYTMPDDIKIINQGDYFKNLSNEDISQKYDERILFQTLLIFGRYGATDYINLLIELIEGKKPSLMALNAADRYRKFLLTPDKS